MATETSSPDSPARSRARRPLDSRAHRQAYAELSDYLNKVEASAEQQELDATVLWAVKFMQRMNELERHMGLFVLDKKVPSARPSGGEHKTGD